jgi:dTDP-4-dehydrorhamnose reductase
MKILLLGAKGNLGTVFLNSALDYPEHSFIGWDKEDIDVTDTSLLNKKISEIKPNVIINTVAYNDVDKCETNEESAALAEALNVQLVRSLAEFAIEHNCLLLHFSSDYVFSGDVETGYSETTEPSPINIYGQSKLKGEKELISLSGKGLQWYVIRTARLFGTKGRGENAKPTFFEQMLQISKRETTISVVTDEYGCFTYTPDLVVASLDLLTSGSGFGIYHLTNEGIASWYQAAQYFFNQLKIAVNLQPVSGQVFLRPAKRPAYSGLLNTKLPKLRPWQEAVDEYCKKL